MFPVCRFVGGLFVRKKGLGGPGCYSQDDVDALWALAEEPGIVNLFLTYPLFFFITVPSIAC